MIDDYSSKDRTIINNNFSIWQHHGDTVNSTLSKDNSQIVLFVERELTKHTRLVYDLGHKSNQYRGRTITLTVETEISGMTRGSFMIFMQDIDAANRDLQASYSNVVESNGTYQLQVTRTFRDIALWLISFSPGNFTKEINPGAKAIIKKIIIDGLSDSETIIYNDFLIWMHAGDTRNSKLIWGDSQVVLTVEDELTKFTRIVYELGLDANDYKGETAAMTVSFEIAGMTKGTFFIIIQDVDNDSNDFQANYSEVIESNGIHQLKVTRTFRDTDLRLVSFIPGNFSRETNPGAKATIDMIKIDLKK